MAAERGGAEPEFAAVVEPCLGKNCRDGAWRKSFGRIFVRIFFKILGRISAGGEEDVLGETDEGVAATGPNGVVASGSRDGLEGRVEGEDESVVAREVLAQGEVAVGRGVEEFAVEEDFEIFGEKSGLGRSFFLVDDEGGCEKIVGLEILRVAGGEKKCGQESCAEQENSEKIARNFLEGVGELGASERDFGGAEHRGGGVNFLFLDFCGVAARFFVKKDLYFCQIFLSRAHRFIFCFGEKMRKTLLIAVLAAGLVLGGCSLMPTENAATETGAVETGGQETEGTTVEMIEEEMADEADAVEAEAAVEVAPAGADIDAAVEAEEEMME